MTKHERCQRCCLSFSDVCGQFDIKWTRARICIRIKLLMISICGIKWMLSLSEWTHSSLCSYRQVGNSVCHIKTPSDSWESTHVPAVERYDWLHPDPHVSPELSGLVSDLWGAILGHSFLLQQAYCKILIQVSSPWAAQTCDTRDKVSIHKFSWERLLVLEAIRSAAFAGSECFKLCIHLCGI